MNTKFWLIIGLGALLVSSTGYASPSNNHTLDDCIRNSACNDVLSVGHRGTIIWGTENTIDAFKAAIELGADAVEMDVRNTKDGQLILMHDDTLDRTTNCSGPISQKTWDEIKDCRVLPILPGIPSAKIPTIPTFFDTLRTLKKSNVFEGTVIDVDVNTPLITQVVSEIIAAKMQDQVMVLTSSKVEADNYASKGIAVLALADSYNKVLEFLELDTQPVAIEVDIKLLPLVQKQVHSSGSRVFVDALGGCDLLGKACYRQLVKLGADLIQTDNLPKLVPFLKTVSNLSPTECLFNWAESSYPTMFAPSGAVSQFSSPFTYRYYSETNIYLGVSSADNHVYYLDAYGFHDVGPLSGWLTLAGCQ
jgi:glycerophosphoryl diester phosphodiesterase